MKCEKGCRDGFISPGFRSKETTQRVFQRRLGTRQNYKKGLVTGLIPSRTEPETELEGSSRVQCHIQDSGQPCIHGNEKPPCWNQQTKVRSGLKTHAGIPPPHNISVGQPGTQSLRLHDGRPAQSVSGRPAQSVSSLP